VIRRSPNRGVQATESRCAIALAPLRVTTLLVSLNLLSETVFRARLRIQPAGGHPYPEAGPINQVVSDGTAVDAALASPRTAGVCGEASARIDAYRKAK
jgi:hypothetical protein